MLVALEGEPLLLEVYSDVNASRKILRETLRAISFDSLGVEFKHLEKPRVQEFIEKSELRRMQILSDKAEAVLMAGGHEQTDTRGVMGRDGRLIQVSVINRNHRILLEA
jgi:peroxiredoxin